MQKYTCLHSFFHYFWIVVEVMENRCGTIDYYKEAVECSRQMRLKDAFEDYCKVFFTRLNPSCCINREFQQFFRFQLANYLAEKNNYFLGIPEGDMVSDLIQMTYDEFLEEIESSQIPVSRQGRLNMLSHIHIVFPCQFETEE